MRRQLVWTASTAYMKCGKQWISCSFSWLELNTVGDISFACVRGTNHPRLGVWRDICVLIIFNNCNLAKFCMACIGVKLLLIVSWKYQYGPAVILTPGVCFLFTSSHTAEYEAATIAARKGRLESVCWSPSVCLAMASCFINIITEESKQQLQTNHSRPHGRSVIET
jgi:hypothetical protein